MANGPKNKLTQIKPGQVLNPFGRKGKAGNGGFSLKESYRKYINTLGPEVIDSVWFGLICKCQAGDVAALKLLVELNNEQINEQVQQNENNRPQIVINIPKMEE